MKWHSRRRSATDTPKLYEDNVVGLVSVLITERTFFNPLYSSLYTLTCDGSVQVQYEHGSKTLFSLENYDCRETLLDDLVNWCDENLTKEDQISQPAQATAI